MSLTPVEAIAYLQQFLHDPSARFYVVPSSVDVNAAAEANDFMESCWRSSLPGERRRHTSPLPSPVAKNPEVTTLPLPNVSKEADRFANIVHYDSPSLDLPETGAVGSFFTSTVLPTKADAVERRGRNGVAWVVM